MAQNKKRGPEEEAAVDLSSVHHSRKKRVKYSEEDAQLAQIYDNLADEVQTVRIKAAGDLLRNLTSSSPDKNERLDAAEKRLIRGLCSGRKSARLGFSIALTELLRLKLKVEHNDDINLVPTIDKIRMLTESEAHASGQEKRDHLLGRRFALQAMLQSDVGLRQQLTSAQWCGLVQAVFDLAAQKPWLRKECMYMLYEYLISPQGTQLDNTRVQAVNDALSASKILKTPEAVGLWIAVKRGFPDVTFPKGVWHHNDPLSSKERSVLAKVMLETTNDDDSSIKKSGSRQSSPSFAWTVILSQLSQQDDSKKFAKFWDTVVASTMFSNSASSERKIVGLQIFSLATSMLPKSILAEVLHQSILRCILDHRASPERYLFDASKTACNQLISRTKQEPEVAGTIACGIVKRGAVNFDQLTKTKTVETVISLADALSLEELATQLRTMMDSDQVKDDTQADNRRRMLSDIQLTMVRCHKNAGKYLLDASEEDDHPGKWLKTVLRTFANFGYGGAGYWTAFSDAIKVTFRSRLTSCLSILIDVEPENASKAALFVAEQVDRKSPLFGTTDPRTKQALIDAWKYIAGHGQPDTPNRRAFALLMSLSILQVHNEEVDAVAALEDLNTLVQANDSSDDSNTLLVELLLSFISKPSALFRKLSEQVFSVVAADLTADSLESLVDILGQKETLGGQQEMFDQPEDGQDDEFEAEDGATDVENASNVELVNGDEVSSSGSGANVEEDDASEDSSDGNGGGEADEDEEAAFDRKLADALGTHGMENDSGSDDSDMDDEEMMALEPHLTTIFKERQKTASGKQQKKDAKENVVNFKNRVLDLLTIYVKSQHASIVALDLLLPLTVLVRTTTSKPTAEKAFAVLKQYFEATNKNKALPRPTDTEACFEVLASLHEEMKLDGSKLHANACSRSSLFLSKALVAIDQLHYQRIAEMYAQLQSEWYLDSSSKVHGSIFTEWTSWSITTRKHD